jgi:hypothetical protein
VDVMSSARQGMDPAGMSASHCDDVEECSVAFLGDHDVCVVMTKMGVPRWSAGRIGRVEDAGEMWVRLGVCWHHQPN